VPAAAAHTGHVCVCVGAATHCRHTHSRPTLACSVFVCLFDEGGAARDCVQQHACPRPAVPRASVCFIAMACACERVNRQAQCNEQGRRACQGAVACSAVGTGTPTKHAVCAGRKACSREAPSCVTSQIKSRCRNQAVSRAKSTSRRRAVGEGCQCRRVRRLHKRLVLRLPACTRRQQASRRQALHALRWVAEWHAAPAAVLLSAHGATLEHRPPSMHVCAHMHAHVRSPVPAVSPQPPAGPSALTCRGASRGARTSACGACPQIRWWQGARSPRHLRARVSQVCAWVACMA
jgi:hypothetical protein